MANYLVIGLLCLIFFETVILLILLDNLRALRRLGDYPVPVRWPRVSVLVPARNEEANIGPCVESLLAQRYPDFEVLVLDDHSNDGTWRILSTLASQNERLQILRGQVLPPDWLGKHWACHQLAQAAEGDLLLFTDADTRHHPLMLRDSLAALLAEDADLLSALPQEQTGSWAERLMIPLMLWSILAFVPLRLAYRLRLPALSATIGQFMLFRRTAFDQVGGFAAVRQHVADDLALGRRIKAAGLRWRLVDGSRRVQCRMYHNFREVYEGFSKNLFAAFGYNILSFLFVWSWLSLVFLGPLAIIGLLGAGVALSPLSIGLSLAAVVLALLMWGAIHWRFDFPRYLPLLYPVTILFSVIIATRSLILTLAGWSTWKGRRLIRHKTG